MCGHFVLFKGNPVSFTARFPPLLSVTVQSVCMSHCVEGCALGVIQSLSSLPFRFIRHGGARGYQVNVQLAVHERKTTTTFHWITRF